MSIFFWKLFASPFILLVFNVQLKPSSKFWKLFIVKSNNNRRPRVSRPSRGYHLSLFETTLSSLIWSKLCCKNTFVFGLSLENHPNYFSVLNLYYHFCNSIFVMLIFKLKIAGGEGWQLSRVSYSCKWWIMGCCNKWGLPNLSFLSHFLMFD